MMKLKLWCVNEVNHYPSVHWEDTSWAGDSSKVVLHKSNGSIRKATFYCPGNSGDTLTQMAKSFQHILPHLMPTLLLYWLISTFNKMKIYSPMYFEIYQHHCRHQGFIRKLSKTNTVMPLVWRYLYVMLGLHYLIIFLKSMCIIINVLCKQCYHSAI
jgi:hypothetical protein